MARCDDGIDQGAVVVLAVDLDQGRADGLEHLHAHRLVVDEGAGAPVRHLNAAEDQVAVDVDIGLRRDAAGRMVDGAVEHGGDLALVLAMADEAAVAAPAEGKAKASSRMDLPAPVSPVRTLRPSWK